MKMQNNVKTLINDEAMRALSISFCEKAANDGDAESTNFNFATLLLGGRK